MRPCTPTNEPIRRRELTLRRRITISTGRWPDLHRTEPRAGGVLPSPSLAAGPHIERQTMSDTQTQRAVEELDRMIDAVDYLAEHGADQLDGNLALANGMPFLAGLHPKSAIFSWLRYQRTPSHATDLESRIEQLVENTRRFQRSREVLDAEDESIEGQAVEHDARRLADELRELREIVSPDADARIEPWAHASYATDAPVAPPERAAAQSAPNDLHPANWFATIATKLTPGALRMAGKRDDDLFRIKRGSRWYYSAASVATKWPDLRDRILSEHERTRANK